MLAHRDIQFNARTLNGKDCPEDVNNITDAQIDEGMAIVAQVVREAVAAN